MLALDYAERVRHLAVLDIVPTLDAWDLADARFAEGYWQGLFRRRAAA